MTQREVITEAMLQAAIAALDRRIAMLLCPRREVIRAEKHLQSCAERPRKHSLPDTLLKRCLMISRVLASA
jgi:hypothetical protein